MFTKFLPMPTAPLPPDAVPAHDRAYLRRLLSQRNQSEGRVAEIDAAIEHAFVRTVSMLVLDMCGFSRITARHGIIHFLAMVHQMEQAARPAIAGNGGEVVKQEADNLFAVFSYGPTLVIAEKDLFGHEMNHACKLGEDIAGPGEIYLTGNACQALPQGRYVFSEAPHTIGGAVLPSFRLEGCLYEGPLAP